MLLAGKQTDKQTSQHRQKHSLFDVRKTTI